MQNPRISSLLPHVVAHAFDVEGAPSFVLAPVFVLVEDDFDLHLLNGFAVGDGLLHFGVELFEVFAVGGGVFLGAEFAVAGGEDIEIHGFDLFDGVHPFGEVGVAQGLVGQPVDGDEVDGEECAFVGEVSDDHAVGVAFAEIVQVNLFAAKFDGVAVGEGDIGDGGGDLVFDDIGLGLFVGHHGGTCFLPDFAASDMVGMVMAVDDILDWLAELAVNLVH